MISGQMNNNWDRSFLQVTFHRSQVQVTVVLVYVIYNQEG